MTVMRINGFTIVIPTYNRLKLLGIALSSVQALEAPTDCEVEVLVIDNNSTGDTAGLCESYAKMGPFPVRHVVERKQGASHARNRALLEAQFEHLVFLDDDMRVSPSWLHGYLDAWRVFRPELVVGPVKPLYDEEPPLWMTPAMFDSLISTYSNKGDQLIQVPRERGHEIPGCNFGVLRKSALAVGGFETRIDRRGESLLGGGDWDLGRKIVGNGGRVAYSPKCQIEHFISRSKMSRNGMRSRWRDLGRTQHAWELIRGERIASRRRGRLILRIGRHYTAMGFARISGNYVEAFRQELLALRLRGYPAILGMDR